MKFHKAVPIIGMTMLVLLAVSGSQDARTLFAIIRACQLQNKPKSRDKTCAAFTVGTVVTHASVGDVTGGALGTSIRPACCCFRSADVVGIASHIFSNMQDRTLDHFLRSEKHHPGESELGHEMS